MTTTKQDKEFIEQMISRTLLEEAIEWIRDHMQPEEVFTDAQLKDWAESNGFEQTN